MSVSCKTMNDSFARRFGQFLNGEKTATNHLLSQYFEKITQIAKRILARRHIDTRVIDEEDIAVSVLQRLCELRDREYQRLSRIKSRDQLLSFMILLITGKISDARRKMLRKRRGGGKVGGESWFAPTDDGTRAIESVAMAESSVCDSVANAEDRSRLIELLPNKILHQTARLYLEGYNNNEIAERLAVQRQTISLRLEKIHAVWRFAFLVKGTIAENSKQKLDELLDLLPKSTRAVAEMQLLGFSNFKIAKRLEIDRVAVELELERLFSIWRDTLHFEN